MKTNPTSINNNEALASIAIGYLIKLHGQISISKALLTLPFILHPQTVKKLRSSSYKRSIEEFILKNPECIFGFNARFEDQLTISINAITILSEMDIISIYQDELRYNEKANFEPEYNEHKIGKRAFNFLNAITTLSDLLKNQSDNSLYLKLKVEL